MQSVFGRAMVAWLAIASVIFSLALACAAPFAGLAAAALLATNALAFAVLAGSVFVAQQTITMWRQPRRA